jgi:hypothetical protein
MAALRGADLPGYEDRAPVMAARDIGWLRR